MQHLLFIKIILCTATANYHKITTYISVVSNASVPSFYMPFLRVVQTYVQFYAKNMARYKKAHIHFNTQHKAKSS